MAVVGGSIPADGVLALLTEIGSALTCPRDQREWWSNKCGAVLLSAYTTLFWSNVKSFARYVDLARNACVMRPALLYDIREVEVEDAYSVTNGLS
ncbi:hypothetical protein Hypma_002900 [Hypsizygus marmoreus]|uniref:Uncharacterized protein n=1 Tax=Hypsizygus marmoreus TaxID=39966 RepID=A0A369J4U1_HYPMA|nr:hypothetical protein Hypma_002900 [Hypsizygus marmoreus]